MIRTVFLLVLMASVAGCGLFQRGNPGRNSESISPLPYKATLAFGEDPRDVTIRVQNQGAGVEEVRESVRYEATRYCLLKFGGSDAEWVLDPATNDWAFVQEGDVLVFNARCTVR